MSDLAELSSARRNVYQFLASVLLGPPDRQVVAMLLGGQCAAPLASLFPGLGELMAAESGGIDSEIEKARADFEALLVVPSGRYLTPFESVYAEPGRRGLLMGPAARSAAQAYRRAGAELASKGGCLPDHIGVEVSFMELLCSREDEAWRGGRKDEAMSILLDEADFLGSHLGKWAGEIADLMERNADGAFYKAVSRLLREVVGRDGAALSALRRSEGNGSRTPPRPST